MKILVLTIFPEIFSSFLETSLIKKALDKNLLKIDTIDIRTFAEPPHFKVDDTPYGGGPGMVMRPEPLAAAIEHAKQILPNAPVIFLSPSGKLFSQAAARKLSQENELILLCGRYEGIDQRIIDKFIDAEISIGDYVLMGGELPAMVIIEAATRLIPGVLGNAASVITESFSNAEEPRLEAPCYTKPAEFDGQRVPEILLSGNHAHIEVWRQEQGRERTAERRPDLLPKKRPQE